MKTNKSPESTEVTSSKKKLKQARLPFMLISDVSPKAASPPARKRKLSVPESEPANKVGKICKENGLADDIVVISDEDSRDASKPQKDDKPLNPYVKLVDAAWKKKQQKGKAPKKAKKPTRKVAKTKKDSFKENVVENEQKSDNSSPKRTRNKQDTGNKKSKDILPDKDTKNDQKPDNSTPKLTRTKTKKETNSNTSIISMATSKLDESMSSLPGTPKHDKSAANLDESMNDSNANTSVSNLTPKQLQKRVESAKEKEEREKEKQEHEKKRQQEKEERAKQKQERREREEREEAKKREREDKEEQKRKEREEREKQKELLKNVDVNIERDFSEPGEGSDVEHEECLGDITLKQNVEEYPVDIDRLADPSLAEAIRSIDTEADLALRTVLGPGPDQDLLHFDWNCEPENFKGVREVFSVPSTGPTFENAELTPLEVFLKIWDADIIAHIVRETNRYGCEMVRRNEKPNSRLKRWKDVTDDDIKKFFAIIMLQSLVINNVEREYWYPKVDILQIGNFGAIMPYNRFLEIKRCLHFVDNASLPEHPNRLHKIMPIIEHLNNKFSSLYVLEQNIAIDESLLLWKGRLSFSQKIVTKKARVGVKSYELCESTTGYLWRMEVYSGKGHDHVAQVGGTEPVGDETGDEPESATSQIVLTLMRPLTNRGHTIVMDHFYNAPLLSRILKVKHKTDSMGTLRLDREFVPEGLKNEAKRNMKAGEVAFSTTNDLSVVVWMDKNVVAMISTFHEVKIGGIEKYDKYKPQVILDYNLSMGGIDHKDQMLRAYPIERVRNIIWYKKLFRRLLNVSIHNSFVMFNHNRTRVIGNREFRLQLAKQLLQMCRPQTLRRPIEPAAPAAPSQMHLPAKNERAQRCKLCASNKVRRTTVWRCSSCKVNLCIDGCYTDYHNSL